MRKYYLVACAISFLLIPGKNSYGQFLSGNDFYANTLQSPELILENAKKVAILNFNDENNPSYNYWNDTKNMGGKLADAIVANLLNDSYGIEKGKPLYFTGFRTNIYTVVERSQLDNVLKEQKLGASGAIGDSEASQAGKLLGLDVIISGAVSYSHRDARDQSSSKDDKGNVTYTYTVTRVVNANARVKFIKVETGQVLAVKEFSTEVKDSKSDSKNYPYSQLASADVIAERAFGGLSDKITSYFSPSFSYTGLDIMKIKSKEYKDQYREAVDHMKDKRIDKALIVFNAIYEKDSYNQEAANNLAVLYEGTANYEKALEFYKISAELNPEKKSFKEAIARIENLIKLKTNLETSYGIKIASYEFAAEGSGSSKLADKVTTKGKTKDRYDVRDTPSESGSVVAKVPGDTEFEIIEKSGNWVKIKLLGGKSGYIVASDVRE